jgi:hypothetical protein
MAATHELDVSIALDDIGFHFGNWHDHELAKETASGLTELGAVEIASLFDDAFRIAKDYWNEMGNKNWMDWYDCSDFDFAVRPIDSEVRSILKDRVLGIMSYWVDYARRYSDMHSMIDA